MPPGCECIVYNKPSSCQTWAVYRSKAYYTAPVLKYYRCYKVHIQKTLAKRITDTIVFLLYNIDMLKTISVKVVLDQIKDLIKLLQRHKPNLPYKVHKDETLSVIDKIVEIFTPKYVLLSKNTGKSPRVGIDLKLIKLLRVNVNNHFENTP